MVLLYQTYEESKKAYERYLQEHIANVAEAWQYIQAKLNNEPFVVDDYLRLQISDLIDKHDASKYGEEEFDPYRRYFYPTPDDVDKDRIQRDYDKAWIHHYTNNPHHWEYWALYDEDKERETLRFVRDNYIVERICDWMAMSKQQHNGMLDWYKANKKDMVMIPDDETFLEMLLEKIGNYPLEG